MTKHSDLTIPEVPDTRDRTTQEHVYARLRYAIMIGAFAPGTDLTMRGLAEAMDLSPTPIREAVRRLSSEHAIEVKQNRRMVVPEMTLGRFEELLALRVALETHAAARSLPYISDKKIDSLIAIDADMDRAFADKDFDGLTILNQEFHRTLYRTNPHQVSLPAIESIWLQLGPFQRQVIKDLTSFYKVDRHKEILTALKSREVAALIAATQNDIHDGISRNGRKLLARMEDGSNGA